MKNVLTRIVCLLLFISFNTIAATQISSSNLGQYRQHHIEASECIAFYGYGYDLTKRDKVAYRIANKFKALDKFLKKQLKLDVSEDDIKNIRKIGRRNFTQYMNDNDHKYEIKIDGYDDELLDLYNKYSTQCENAIKYYQAKMQSKQTQK